MDSSIPLLLIYRFFGSSFPSIGALGFFLHVTFSLKTNVSSSRSLVSAEFFSTNKRASARSGIRPRRCARTSSGNTEEFSVT